MNTTAVLSPSSPALVGQRTIALRTRGRQHGPIVRLVSPSDLGELMKPFVFLDRFDVDESNAPGFGFHPHSGIATLSLLLEGGLDYEDSTGATGTMRQGSVEWMQAGGGVWHKGKATGRRISGYQLWLALPPALENSPALSRYLEAEQFAAHGPARVVLGELGGVCSPISAPSSVNYLDVQLKAGDVWRYDPPEGHDVAWVAVHRGRLQSSEVIMAGELVLFAEGDASITFKAEVDGGFVLGSATKHPHDLVTGSHSVHTSVDALNIGENGIRRIAEHLRRDGRLRSLPLRNR